MDNAIKLKIIGSSPAIGAVIRSIGRFAKSDSTVIITGETGTGKELVARALHDLSERRFKPFVPLNCAGLTGELLESELFGYKKGSFTGAYENRAGLIASADGGMLFLDEISNMPPSTQAKLLRFLQDGVYRPVGDIKPLEADIRVICASNEDLAPLMQERKFRDDLFYRIGTLSIYVPPLRHRPQDIPELVHHFLDIISSKNPNEPAWGTSQAIFRPLKSYHWPGNVRQLRSAIEHATAVSQSRVIHAGHLPAFVKETIGAISSDLSGEADHSVKILKQWIKEVVRPEKLESGKLAWHIFEQQLYERVYHMSNGNQALAMRIMGVSRPTMREKLRQYNLLNSKPKNIIPFPIAASD